MPGKLSEAARVAQRVQTLGQVTHAGEMVGEVSLVLEDWGNKMQEICMVARLEWMQQMQASIEGTAGRRQRVKRNGSRFGEEEMPVEQEKRKTRSGGGGNTKRDAALEKEGFDTLEEAKDDFLKEKRNKDKCFWACSKAGKALGGCVFENCRFVDSHPGQKKKDG